MTLMSALNFQSLHFCDYKGLGEGAQIGQTSHPPNPGDYFTLPP